MVFDTIYWTLSGFWICFPILMLVIAAEKKSHFIPRFTLFILIFLAASYADAQLNYHLNHEGVMYILSIIALHFLSLAALFLCNTMRLREIIYCKIWATVYYYLALQFACLITSILDTAYFYQTLFVLKIIVNIVFCLTLIPLYCFVISKNSYYISNETITASFLITIFGIAFNSVCFYLFQSREVIVYLFQFFSTLVIALVLYLILQSHQRQKLDSEIKLRERLWEEQQKQFELKKEYIDVINHKFHDLKHEIAAIRYMTTDESIKKELDGMASSIQKYGYFVRTGNPVIDTILTEKAEQFSWQNIQMNCMIDDHLDISFIKIIDLYIILGNAMDNVFECLTGEHRPDQGYVNIRMYTDKQFLRIVIKNNYSGTIPFRNGLPVSSKGNDDFHGFGLKSIRQIVHKYDGEIAVQIENSEFILKIMLPVPSIPNIN